MSQQQQDVSYDAIKQFMISKQISGQVLFTMTGGSHCYNCNLENSDLDFLGVYVAPTSCVAGLPDEKPLAAITSTNPDIQLYELGRFCELVQSGNPMIMQMLFTNVRYFATAEFEKLRVARLQLISKYTVNAYIGYVRNELKMALGKEKFEQTKYYYHAMRLVFELERLVQNVAPKIQMDGAERDTLMQIRNKELEMNKVRTEITTRLSVIENAKPWELVLQQNLKYGTAGFDILREWLVALRKQYW